MLSDEIKKVPIDEKKLSMMKRLIVNAERDNLKTGKLTKTEMVSQDSIDAANQKDFASILSSNDTTDMSIAQLYDFVKKYNDKFFAE